jgi:CubicO group peptidase (beta-lactamase class C family)
VATRIDVQCAASTDSADTCLDDTCLASTVLDELPVLAREHQVPGAQLAIHHGGVTRTAEAGEAEFGTGRPVTADTAFPVGSITKSFTATVAMILSADGDVGLDDPVSDASPELDEIGAGVTLRHLLSHTSGLAASHGRGDVPAATLRRHVLEHVCRDSLILPPGAGFSYSNSGYAVVGHLIEAITGMPWAEALEMILLRPLSIEPALVGGLDTVLGTGPGTRPVATGHAVSLALGRTVPVRQERTAGDAPAGALAVSASDLVALGRLHIGRGDPHLLPADCAAQMRRPVPGALPFGLADGWGLGLATYAGGWTGHDGNGEGTACYLRINPADGWVIALTANGSTGGALWQDVLSRLAGQGVPIGPPRDVTPGWRAAAAPDGCAGRYANGDMEFLVSAGSGGAVHLTVDGETSAPLTFHQDLAFSVIDPATGRRVFGGRFVADPATGNIRGMQVGGRFARQLAPARAGAGHWPSANSGSLS